MCFAHVCSRESEVSQQKAQAPGCGLMPVWMREEMKGTKLTKDNFLIK
jgi:hypothetical protein